LTRALAQPPLQGILALLSLHPRRDIEQYPEDAL
jgi:hypothetical protein